MICCHVPWSHDHAASCAGLTEDTITRYRNEWVLLGCWLVALGGALIWSLTDTSGQIRVGAVFTVVILLASLSLTKRTLGILLVAVVLLVLVAVKIQGLQSSTISWTGVATLIISGSVAWLQSRRRHRLGLKQVPAEAVLELIRDRLETQAQLPLVPDGWLIEVDRRAADGAAISGDFVASRLVRDQNGHRLHLAIFDVSGNGITAGPRALLLSGAVGGLLGSVDPDDFLHAANDYLLRQHWSLGFASASYILLNIDTGRYEIRSAGHPPALHYRCDPRHGDGAWRDSLAAGTLLGVLPRIASTSDSGVLEPGDALIAYTDGVVEARTRDLDQGVMRLKAQVELIAARGQWPGSAARLIHRVPIDRGDDRTVVVVRRSAASIDRAGELRHSTAALQD